jgi:hypothetical protein
LAAKVEDAVVLVVVVLAVTRAEEIEAKGDLVFSAQDVHVVRSLEAGDGETAERAGPAANCEASVVDAELQKIVGSLIHVRDAEFRRVDAVGIGASFVGPAANSEMEGVYERRGEGIGVAQNERLRAFHISCRGCHQDIVRVEERRESVTV